MIIVFFQKTFSAAKYSKMSLPSVEETKSLLLRIDSDERISGTTGRFTINLDFTDPNITAISGLVLHSIMCPNAFDNVDSFNNTFVLNDGADHTITIPKGYYSITQLATELETQINAVLGGGSVNVSIVGVPPNQKFSFLFNLASYTFIEASSTMAKILGLTADLLAPIGVDTPLQSIPWLGGPTQVYIHCKNISSGQLYESSGIFSSNFVVNMDSPWSSYCYSSYGYAESQTLRYLLHGEARPLNHLNIRLRDADGNILNFYENFRFIMLLKCYYI